MSAKAEIAGGTGILPVIPNRQAGSLSHRSLLAMTQDQQLVSVTEGSLREALFHCKLQLLEVKFTIYPCCREFGCFGPLASRQRVDAVQAAAERIGGNGFMNLHEYQSKESVVLPGSGNSEGNGLLRSS